MIILYLLLAFTIIAAIVAIESHDLISSVISAGAVGLGLCIIFLLLGAPELALIQIVVEILVLIVLIRATIAVSVPETYRGRERLSYGIIIIFIVMVILFSQLFLRAVPKFGDPIMRISRNYIEEGEKQTGSSNIVAAVSIGYRGLDVLGASSAIFASAIGLFAILRLKGRKRT